MQFCVLCTSCFSVDFLLCFDICESLNKFSAFCHQCVMRSDSLFTLRFMYCVHQLNSVDLLGFFCVNLVFYNVFFLSWGVWNYGIV